MPEGPEIILLQEAALSFVGARVQHAGGNAPGLSVERLKGQVLLEVRTHGKELFFCFTEFAIRIHLALFGKWVLNGTIQRQLRFELVFETGTLRFYECTIQQVVSTPEAWAQMGKDVFHPAFDTEAAALLLAQNPERLVCDALLNQRIFPGVGNGIKNEVLFRRQVHPLSEMGAMPQSMLRKLATACVEQSRAYLEHLREGNLPAYWQVYRKKQCIRDGLHLRFEKLGQTKRSSYYCERCQALFLPEML